MQRFRAGVGRPRALSKWRWRPKHSALQTGNNTGSSQVAGLCEHCSQRSQFVQLGTTQLQHRLWWSQTPDSWGCHQLFCQGLTSRVFLWESHIGDAKFAPPRGCSLDSKFEFSPGAPPFYTHIYSQVGDKLTRDHFLKARKNARRGAKLTNSKAQTHILRIPYLSNSCRNLRIHQWARIRRV